MFQCCKQVLLTYLTRKLFWLFAVLYLLSIPMGVTFSRWGKETAEVFPLVLQVFFLGAYLSFGIGAHLKQQFANPRAKMFPGFARPHLLVGVGAILLLTTASALIAAWPSNIPLLGLMAFILHINSLALWLGANPKPLPLTAFMATVLLLPTSGIGRALFVEITMGREPILAASMLMAHLFGLGVLVLDMAELDEDRLDYERVQAFNMWDMRAGPQRAFNRNVAKSGNWLIRFVSWFASHELERATRRVEGRPINRLKLLALGDNWPNPMALNLVIFGAIVLGLVWVGRSWFGNEQIAKGMLMQGIPMSMAFVWGSWLAWMQRWPRLGYESLRPVSRQEWVWENGVAIAKTMVVNHVIALTLLTGILLAVLPDFASSPKLWQTLVVVTAAQVAAFGLMSWVVSFGSVMATAFMTAPLVTAPAFGVLAISEKAESAAVIVLCLSAGCIIFGVLMSRMAYTKWCRMDLP